MTQNQQLTRRPWMCVIPAGETRRLTANGDYFYIDSVKDVATALDKSIELSLNGLPLAPVRAGHSNQGIPGQGNVGTLDFKNTTAASVLVVVIYGNGASNFAGTVTIQNASLALDAATIAALTKFQAAPTMVFGGIGVTTLTAGNNTGNLPGTPNLAGRTRRKYILVSNLSATDYLVVRNGANNISVGVVFPKTAFILETDADLCVTNTSANPVDCYVSQVFYTT
jgi:hypothetical protein